MGDIVLVEGDNVLDIQLTPIPPLVTTLYGVVTDAQTGYPLSGVRVTIDGLTTYTNANGEYGFTGLEPRGYVGEVSKEGYQTEVF